MASADPAPALVAGLSDDERDALRAFTPRRPYLVFVRASVDSLHSNWLEHDPERTWDCIVSFYGPPEQASEAPGDLVIAGGNSKCDHFKMVADEFPDLVDQYDAIAIADPDLEIGPRGLSELFAIGAAHGLDIFQPSLTPESHRTHYVTLRQPSYAVRETTFVEVMCPVFSRRGLARSLPWFDFSVSTWGVDLLWSSARSEGLRLGVVDSVAIGHLKPIDPVSGPWYTKLRAMGLDAEADLARVYDELDGRIRYPRTIVAGSTPAAGYSRARAWTELRWRSLPENVRRIRAAFSRRLG